MIDRFRLLASFLQLVRIPSLSGQEAQVAAAIGRDLESLGLYVEKDSPGNLLVRLAAGGSDSGADAFLLTAHMDTVGPCGQVTPVVVGDLVTSDGTTTLGGDDKAGVAIILEVLRVLCANPIPHLPIEALFTVREETGLEGAKACVAEKWLRARWGIGLDAGGPQGTIVNGAPSHDTLRAEIRGRAAHAGVCPEAGINAIVAACEGIVAMPLGRIDDETTANIGIICGGVASNIVPETVVMQGEARSHDRLKLAKQSRTMVQALEQAAQKHGATVSMTMHREYESYRFDEGARIIRHVSAAMRSVGVEPILWTSGGGSDANILNAAGIETVQISAGMAQVHTCQERIDLEDMVTAARIVLACVTLP